MQNKINLEEYTSEIVGDTLVFTINSGNFSGYKYKYLFQYTNGRISYELLYEPKPLTTLEKINFEEVITKILEDKLNH